MKTREIKYNTVSRKKRRMDVNTPVEKGDVLSIDPSLLDDRFEYYWASDKPGNIQKKQAKDWDIVTDMSNVTVGDEEAGTVAQDGSMVTIPSGDGNLVLMSKKKEWCDADRAKIQEHISENEKAIKQKNEKDFIKVKE